MGISLEYGETMASMQAHGHWPWPCAGALFWPCHAAPGTCRIASSPLPPSTCPRGSSHTPSPSLPCSLPQRTRVPPWAAGKVPRRCHGHRHVPASLAAAVPYQHPTNPGPPSLEHTLAWLRPPKIVASRHCCHPVSSTLGIATSDTIYSLVK